ncbi:universal stress protein [Natrialbaceae archaeon A-arb3/5]
MTRKILVPIDESDRSSDALEYALTEYGDETIIALHVINPREFFSAGGIESGITANQEQLQEAAEGRAEEVLDSARDETMARGVEIETETLIGDVANSIVSYADEQAVDHIVIGSHGRSGASRVLLGSVAETVTRRAAVPVTVVR